MSEFDFHLDDGRVAQLREVMDQPYADCTFSAGLVEGLGPDTIYLKFDRDADDESYTFFLRPDEAQAVAMLLNAALWSKTVMENEDADCDGSTRHADESQNGEDQTHAVVTCGNGEP